MHEMLMTNDPNYKAACARLIKLQVALEDATDFHVITPTDVEIVAMALVSTQMEDEAWRARATAIGQELYRMLRSAREEMRRASR